MSPALDQFADALYEEVLTEAAQNFFGARSALDDQIEQFHRLVLRLKSLEREAFFALGTLHFLLLSDDGVTEFYRRIGVQPMSLPVEVSSPARLFLSWRPLALTARGRYAKAVLRAYSIAQEACEVYMDGRWKTMPDGTKRKTVNFKQIIELHEMINKRIRKINGDMAPSCVMSYAKGLDPSKVEREKLSGATIDGYACNLDDDLAFHPVEFDSLGLHGLTELPGPDTVRKTVRAYAHELYGLHPGEVREAMDSL